MIETIAATPKRFSGTKPDRATMVTKSLLGYGVIAGPIYVLVSTAQALTRDGFDVARHQWSLLVNGGLGWIQIANLALTGLMTSPVDSPPMTYLDEQGRPEPPVAGDETATLLGCLERVRATLAWKCGELDAAGLRAMLPPSSITLGGLLKHLALVEDEYFSRRLLGRDLGPPWDAVDWDADPNWEWHSAAEDTPEQLFALWQDAVARSRSAVAEALADGVLEQLIQHTWPDGRTPSLRRMLVDLIEEYARHVGHADLIRESVDGLVGEDPPG